MNARDVPVRTSPFDLKTCMMRAVVWAWLAVTGVALVGMYRLWWTRERVLYLGRSSVEQRAIVVTRAGLSPGTLALAGVLDRTWPRTARYTADGSEVTLSYAKYLLVPRIPSGSEHYRLIEDTRVTVPTAPRYGESDQAPPPFFTVPRTSRGLFLSGVILAGIAAGLRASFHPLGLSVPEGMGLTVFGLCLSALLSKGLLGSITPAFAVFTAMGVAGIGWRVWHCVTSWRHHRAAGPGFCRTRALPRLVSFLLLCGVIVAAASFWSLIMAVVVVPDDWDAWAQWGPKAKVLALGAGSLSDVRFFVPGSGDYPLLWPSVWAFSGWCAGGWEDQWSKGWGPLFLVLAAWQIQVAVRNMTSRAGHGMVAATVFVSMPAVPLIASWAYAESPLWLMMASAIGRLMAWRMTRRTSDLALGAVFAAAAAYTKNEGALFAVLGLLWVFLNSASRASWRTTALPALVVLALYIPWVWYVRLNLGLSDHATQGLVDPGRWDLALRRLGPALAQIVGIWRDVRQWNVVLAVLLVSALGLAVRGPASIRRDLLVPAGMLAGSLVVLLFHPSDLQWQLGVAWNRLTAQVAVPLTVIVACGLAGARHVGQSVPIPPERPVMKPAQDTTSMSTGTPGNVTAR